MSDTETGEPLPKRSKSDTAGVSGRDSWNKWHENEVTCLDLETVEGLELDVDEDGAVEDDGLLDNKDKWDDTLSEVSGIA